MDCDDCLEKLYTFLDTELSETDIVAVRSHLDGCDDCEGNYVFEETFLSRLKDCVTSDVAPVELRQRVILKLRGSSPPPTTR